MENRPTPSETVTSEINSRDMRMQVDSWPTKVLDGANNREQRKEMPKKAKRSWTKVCM